MKKVLFIVTLMSDSMLFLLLKENAKNNVIVVTPYPDVKNNMDRLGIPCFSLRNKNLSISEKDRLFAEEMMPGKMEVYNNLPETELPVWKVISLDRLKFWFDHTADKNMGFIDGIDADKIYVSMDINSPYPWYASAYKYSGVETVAVQCSPIKTPEFMLLAGILNFDTYVVASPEEELFLKKLGVKGKVAVTNLSKTKEGLRETDAQLREKIKEKAVLNGEVIGVIFDKRDEWQARKFLSETDSQDVTVLLFPSDKRSAELSFSVLAGHKYYIQFDKAMYDACDKIVAFRWDDNYFGELPPDTFVIIDPLDMNFSGILSPKAVRVT
jgi:hypothetical protein